MPYQLRRIVAINILNSVTRLPSSCITELDPRGSVLAVGTNGIGKTTFLRLLPLFYGATPQQVLRGSGRSSMIAHTLPAPSSAVVYEYERENDQDLRCVVMHCEPGADRPIFRIIENGGFREELFYDEDGVFVDYADFPARAERLGAQLSQRLPLNLYRSVILNEKLPTKEGARIRDLAAKHSLGPGPLTHLDQIAAAMANEKISFRDLQNIVIDRITDQGVNVRANSNNRDLRKKRKDVVKWIHDRDHMVRVMAQAPQAKILKERVERVRGQHLRMCSLHLFVKEALNQVRKEKAALDLREASAKLEFDKQSLETNELATKHEGALRDCKAALELANDALKNVQSKSKHFDDIGAIALSEQQDKEEQLQALKTQAQDEIDRLTAGSERALTQSDLRKSEINQKASTEVTGINARETDFVRTAASRKNDLHKEEQNALSAVSVPSRRTEIDVQRESNISTLGELKTLISNPIATPEATSRLEAAGGEAERLASELTKATAALSVAERLEREAKAQLDESLAAQALVSTALAQAQSEVRIQKDRLNPSPGSLLAYLRSAEPASWAGAARVLDPALLGRNDLAPTGIVGANVDSSGQLIAVGSLVLNVHPVDEPDWVDMAHLRDLIAKAEARVTRIGQELGAATELAKTHATIYSLAHSDCARKKASESLVSEGKTNADGALVRARNVVMQEKASCKQSAEGQQSKLADDNKRLLSEAFKIDVNVVDAKQEIQTSFKNLRGQIDKDGQDAAVRFQDERTSVEKRRFEAIRTLDEDVASALNGLGIDPTRIQTLQKQVNEYAGRLNSIASKRHEVTQWRKFEREELPLMAGFEQTVNAAHEAVGQAIAVLGESRNHQGALVQEIKKTEAGFKDQHQRIDNDTTILDALASGPLTMYIHMGVSATTIDVDWTAQSLERQVRECRKAIDDESEEIVTESRRLRDILAEQAGPIADWIERCERELPDSNMMLDHERRSAKAGVLCDWYAPAEEARMTYIGQLHHEMGGFLATAGEFIHDLDAVGARISAFNRDLQESLGTVSGFKRFKDLSVRVISSVGQHTAVNTLRQMQEVSDSKISTYGAFANRQRELPTTEEAALIRKFRDILPEDGVLRVNLDEHVRLECSLTEGLSRITVSSEDEFKAISSNGNTALITAMFLMGFAEMIRKKNSSVRLTWVTDEIGRFDPGNVREFLHTLDAHKIDVISASPSLDPAQARFFNRLCVFEDNGAIETTETTPFGQIKTGAEHAGA